MSDEKEQESGVPGGWRLLLSEGMEPQVDGTPWQSQLSVESEILFKKLKRNSQVQFQILLRHEDWVDLGGHRVPEGQQKWTKL